MKKFDKDKLSDVDIYLGEPNEQVRESLRAMMRGEGRNYVAGADSDANQGESRQPGTPIRAFH